jgi:flagellar hook assembly protein FlgD
LPNYPNPFNRTTTIEYELTVPADVEISVFDIRGEHVRTLVDGHKGSGVHHARWNGTNNSGERVATGVYFCRMKAGPVRQSRKLILIK